jgi:hypothetical protein
MRIFAITFIAIVTALVTSTLVTQAQRRQQEADAALHPPVHETLCRIDARLDAIEQRLSQR